MPSLDTPSATAWLSANEPALAAVTVRATPLVEDPPFVGRALADFGRALDNALAHNPLDLATRLRTVPNSRALATLLDNLSLATRCRLLGWFARTTTTAGTFLLPALLSPADNPRLPMGLLSLNRQALLARLYTSERVHALLTALDSSKET
jgi:hypothetical protein